MADMNVTIRIPTELKKKLEELGVLEDRPLSSVMRRALARYLETPEIIAMLAAKGEGVDG